MVAFICGCEAFLAAVYVGMPDMIFGCRYKLVYGAQAHNRLGGMSRGFLFLFPVKDKNEPTVGDLKVVSLLFTVQESPHESP